MAIYLAREENGGYRVLDRTIVTPGKFEGCPSYVPFYWNLGLNGSADEDDGEAYRFELNDIDWAMWPALDGVKHLTLVEDGNGFVHHQTAH